MCYKSIYRIQMSTEHVTGLKLNSAVSFVLQHESTHTMYTKLNFLEFSFYFGLHTLLSSSDSISYWTYWFKRAAQHQQIKAIICKTNLNKLLNFFSQSNEWPTVCGLYFSFEKYDDLLWKNREHTRNWNSSKGQPFYQVETELQRNSPFISSIHPNTKIIQNFETQPIICLKIIKTSRYDR